MNVLNYRSIISEILNKASFINNINIDLHDIDHPFSSHDVLWNILVSA